MKRVMLSKKIPVSPQGDCVSANLFTVYPAKALDSKKHDGHDYCSIIVKPPAHITNDHL